jgi:hypothetical protein
MAAAMVSGAARPAVPSSKGALVICFGDAKAPERVGAPAALPWLDPGIPLAI